jgi:hypothetical protein
VTKRSFRSGVGEQTNAIAGAGDAPTRISPIAGRWLETENCTDTYAGDPHRARLGALIGDGRASIPRCRKRG